VKAYLIVTGGLFGLLAVAHFLRTVLEWTRLNSDPWFVVQGPGIGIIGLVLCLWSQRLFWNSKRS
jgi:hypothetical protein